MKADSTLPTATLEKHGIHPNEHRGLSTPEEAALRDVAQAEHCAQNKPHQSPILENDYMSRPGRWGGVRGVADHDLTVSETKLIAAAARDRGHVLSFPERKELLLRFRADMEKFQ